MSENGGPSLPEGEPILRVWPMPTETNGFGAIFGGWIMSQFDVAAGLVACRASRGRVTTAAAKVEFERPILQGDLVSFYAEAVGRGRTSITVRAEAYAQRDAGKGGEELVRAATAELVYVALDAEGRKRELPPER